MILNHFLCRKRDYMKIREILSDIKYSYINNSYGWYYFIGKEVGIISEQLHWSTVIISHHNKHDNMIDNINQNAEVYQYNLLVDRYNKAKPFFMPSKEHMKCP